MAKTILQRAALALSLALAVVGHRALLETPLATLPAPPTAPRGDPEGTNRKARRARAAIKRSGS